MKPIVAGCYSFSDSKIDPFVSKAFDELALVQLLHHLSSRVGQNYLHTWEKKRNFEWIANSRVKRFGLEMFSKLHHNFSSFKSMKLKMEVSKVAYCTFNPLLVKMFLISSNMLIPLVSMLPTAEKQINSQTSVSKTKHVCPFFSS